MPETTMAVPESTRDKLKSYKEQHNLRSLAAVVELLMDESDIRFPSVDRQPSLTEFEDGEPVPHDEQRNPVTAKGQVITALLNSDGMSQGEIVDETGLGQAAVSKALSDLDEQDSITVNDKPGPYSSQYMADEASLGIAGTDDDGNLRRTLEID